MNKYSTKKLFEKNDKIPTDIKKRIKKIFANIDLAEAGRKLKLNTIQYYKRDPEWASLSDDQKYMEVSHIYNNNIPTDIYCLFQELRVKTGKSTGVLIADILYGRDLDISLIENSKISYENKIKLLKRALNRRDALIFLHNNYKG